MHIHTGGIHGCRLLILVTQEPIWATEYSWRRHKCSSILVPCLCSTGINSPISPPSVINASITSPPQNSLAPAACSTQFTHDVKSHMTSTYKYDCAHIRAGMRSAVCTYYIGIMFFPLYFQGFLCMCTSAAPQRPAHGTVSSQVATHLRTDRVCRVLGRSWIRTQDY